MNGDIYVAWLDHRDTTGHVEVEILWPAPEADKQPHPIGWRCKLCGASVGEVPR